MLRKLFHNWEKELLRPIVISVATALILFLASLLIPAVNKALFPGEERPWYPIYCVAEPYRNPDDPKKLNIDFFIVNRRGDSYTWSGLEIALGAIYGPDVSNISPIIRLKYSARSGEVVAESDSAFNDGRGFVGVTMEGNDVVMKIDSIEARAILKVAISVAGFERIHDQNVNVGHTTRASVIPFKYNEYQDNCFSH